MDSALTGLSRLCNLLPLLDAGGCTIGRVTTPHDDLDRHVRDGLARLGAHVAAPPSEPGLLMLFDAMAGSRLLDLEARRMRDRGEGFYTISSAGHESNAIVAAEVRPGDPALLHYRSGGFFLARSLQAGRSRRRPARGAARAGRRRRGPGLRWAAQGVG